MTIAWLEHPGITKRRSRISIIRFYWPQMVCLCTDTSIVLSLYVAAKSLPSQALQPSSIPPNGKKPWDSILMDFIKGLPLSDGHEHNPVGSVGSVPSDQDGTVHSHLL